MRDGLYRITRDSFCAGFVVEGGKITRCAPILRRRLARAPEYWMSQAVRISNETKTKEQKNKL